MNTPEKKQPAEAGKQQNSPEFSGIYASPELFQGRTEITICHNGESYRLRQTRSGKLILNK